MKENDTSRCRRCGRELKDEVSRKRGYGKTCYSKIKSKDKPKKLF